MPESSKKIKRKLSQIISAPYNKFSKPRIQEEFESKKHGAFITCMNIYQKTGQKINLYKQNIGESISNAKIRNLCKDCFNCQENFNYRQEIKMIFNVLVLVYSFHSSCQAKLLLFVINALTFYYLDFEKPKVHITNIPFYRKLRKTCLLTKLFSKYTEKNIQNKNDKGIFLDK